MEEAKVAAKAISSRRVVRRCVCTRRYTCVSSQPPEIMQASNNEQIEPTHTQAQHKVRLKDKAVEAFSQWVGAENRS